MVIWESIKRSVKPNHAAGNLPELKHPLKNLMIPLGAFSLLDKTLAKTSPSPPTKVQDSTKPFTIRCTPSLT